MEVTKQIQTKQNFNKKRLILNNKQNDIENFKTAVMTNKNKIVGLNCHASWKLKRPGERNMDGAEEERVM